MFSDFVEAPTLLTLLSNIEGYVLYFTPWAEMRTVCAFAQASRPSCSLPMTKRKGSGTATSSGTWWRAWG
jgi:hypothetical protein